MQSTMNPQRGGDPWAPRQPGMNGPPDMRNGSYPRQLPRPPASDAESNQSRAARFEDEKRRVIESCFAKKDPDGTQLESYITHVRVIEDAMYPSSPPPPDAPPNNKKNRVILVAVRRSGKVRVHKARENPNGTFSIGKTWNLDELTAIQSYSAFQPSNQQENFEKQWAGGVGFLVSLGKPYYWQSTTAKEKDFFIASLIKIYRKYTGGKLPQLIGFPSQELDMLTGGSASHTPNLRDQTPPIGMSQAVLPSPPQMPAAASPRPQSPYTPQTPSRNASRPEHSENERAFSRNDYRPMPREGLRQPSEDTTKSPARYAAPPPQPLVEEQRSRSIGEKQPPPDPYRARSPARQEPPQAQAPPPLFANPKSSQSSLSQPDRRVETPTSRQNGVPAVGLAPYGPAKRSLASKSGESFGDGVGSDSSRPPTGHSDRKPPGPAPPLPVELEDNLPGRRRPSLGENNYAHSYHSQATTQATTPFVTPLGTPGLPTAEKTATVESIRPHIPGQFPPPTPLSTNDYFGRVKSNQSTDSKKSMETPKPEPTPAPPVMPSLTPENRAEVVQSPVEKDPEDSKRTEEEYRPGLGPMIKKKSAKEIAGQFRKAALAASAFQPRQGGAGARLKAMQDKNSNEPDGITGVVPAPLFRGMSTDSVSSSAPGTPGLASPGLEKERPGTPLANSVVPRVQIQRTATEDSAKSVSVKSVDSRAKPVEPIEPLQPEVLSESPEKTRSGSPQRKKRQRQEAEIEKFCTILGLDPRVMDGRGSDFNELLTEFGWEGKLADRKKLDDFESDIHREIGRAQAMGWLGHLEQQENRVQDLSRAFDKAIIECEEMDGLLTLYSHELDTLHDDIEYIEAQSQGLQVSTANQKILQSELQSLLKTLTISSADLRALQSAPLDMNEGVVAVERALVLLYRAMITIDPDIRSNRKRQETASRNDRTGVGVYADAEIGQMRAVRQKKENYREETLTFIRRFNQHMTNMFKLAEQRSSEENTRSAASTSTLSLNLPALQTSRAELWIYSPMMLFVREVNSYEWQTLISSYEINIKSTYMEYFRDNVMAQRKLARKPTGEEQEVLFTHQEKEEIEKSITSTAARKLTVKRGKTVKTSGLRQQFGERRDGKPDAWEIFDTVLQDQAKVISEEQNFVVHLFHLTSSSNVDFADEASKVPNQRSLPNLNAQLAYDPDRDMAKIVQQAVEGIYQFWATDMQALMEWVLKTDQLQGVGVLCALERAITTYEETNQEYITRTLRQIHDRLTGLFHKFVEDQIKAIEETKVKINKRKGIISFMRTFPVFMIAVENMIPQEFEHNESLELRFILNDSYTRILKAMWESLNFIAKGNPASGAAPQSSAPTSGDPEDKEALNYHILFIENMNHYIEEVETRHNVVLEEWADRANQDLYKHLTQYTDAVIRRPLGKWLDFIESTEALLKTNDSYASIAKKPSHSRSSAKKVLGAYDAKEVRKGVDTLKKRIEKHFGDVDDPAMLSKSLIQRVFDECGTRYSLAWDRMNAIVDSVYDGGLEIDWRKEEIVGMFKR